MRAFAVGLFFMLFPPLDALALELRLAATAEPGTTDTYSMQASLKNTSQTAMEISWLTYPAEPSLEGYLLKSLILRTEPATHVVSAQSGMSEPVRASAHLQAGQHVLTEWTAACGCLLPVNDTRNRAPCLVEPGLYKVTVTLPRETFHEIPGSIESLPVEIAFGGSAQEPAETLLKVLSVEETENRAVLDSGTHSGIQQGQTFEFSFSLFRAWKLHILRVEPNRAFASITSIKNRHSFEYLDQETTSALVGRTAWREDTGRIPTCK